MLGILLGTTLRWLDQRFIEPDIAKHRINVETEALAPTLTKLENLIAKADESSNRSSKTDDSIARQLESLKSKLGELPKASTTESVVELHGIRADELVKLSSLLHRDLETMKADDPERRKVSDLEVTVNSLLTLTREPDLRAAYPVLKDDTVDQLLKVTK